MAQIKGIDVSKYQGVNLQIETSGLGFAIIKATEALHKDPMCDAHAKEIGDSHLLRGFYHFFRMDTDAIQQAQFFCNTIRPYMDDYSLPPVLDLEDPNATGNIQLAVQQWLDTVENEFGIEPIIYTGIGFMTLHKLNFSRYRLWDAAYRSKPATPYCGWDYPTFWQNTDHSIVPGESAPVDGDIFFGDAHDLGALIKAPTFKDGSDSATWVEKYGVKIY